MEIIKPGTKIDFVGKQKLFGSISAVVCLLALILVLTKGLNYGIDFKGGTEVQLKFKEDVTEGQVRKAMKALPTLTLEKTVVQSFGDPKEHEFLVKIEQVSFLTDQMLKAMCKAVRNKFGMDRVERCKRTAEGVDVVEVKLKEVTADQAGKAQEEPEKKNDENDKIDDDKSEPADSASKENEKGVENGKKNGDKDKEAAGGPENKEEATGNNETTTSGTGKTAGEKTETGPSSKSGGLVTKDDVLEVLKAAHMDHFQVFRMGKKEKQEFRIVFQGLAKQIQEGLEAHFGKGKVEVLRVDAVGAKVGKKLRNDGILAIVYALIGILIYIGLRFDLKFAPGAVVCLIHDVLITVGVFSLLSKEFTLSIIAALLTIVGYSLNDTIVVFDRIRENMLKLRGLALPEITNRSINETLSRTLLTSLTTLVTVAALFIYGGGIIHDFAFAMIMGIVVGTYSSIFVASPIMLYLNKLAEQRSGRRR